MRRRSHHPGGTARYGDDAALPSLVSLIHRRLLSRHWFGLMLLRCPPPQLFDMPVSCSPLAGTRKSYIISGSVAFSCRPLLCSIICSQPLVPENPRRFYCLFPTIFFSSSDLRLVQVLGNLLNHHELNLTNLMHHTTIWPRDVLMISYGRARRYCRCLRTEISMLDGSAWSDVARISDAWTMALRRVCFPTSQAALPTPLSDLPFILHCISIYSTCAIPINAHSII